MKCGKFIAWYIPGTSNEVKAKLGRLCAAICGLSIEINVNPGINTVGLAVVATSNQKTHQAATNTKHKNPKTVKPSSVTCHNIHLKTHQYGLYALTNMHMDLTTVVSDHHCQNQNVNV